MPVKIARSAPRPSFGLPELLVAIHTSRQSCYKAGKSANIHASSGVIRGIPDKMIFLLTLVGANGIVAQTANADDAGVGHLGALNAPHRIPRLVAHRGVFYRVNERTPDMARRSKPGSDFVVWGHCTISMKAQVWTRPSSRESITLAHSPPHRIPRLVPV